MKKTIVIAGAGPAGIAAAVQAAKLGSKVFLCDNNPHSGGQIWRHSSLKPAPPQARKYLAQLDNALITCLQGGQVIDRVQDKTILYSEETGLKSIENSQLILATGARELLLPFPGWPLPQVFGCGGAQALLKAGMNVQGKRIVVAGTGPLLLVVAAG
ncbi:MAG: NAD(P)/FAD-dependent oxidoreductase, partial [Lentisphaeraceae bacterium]|nr:NAD(P)/FAD-dependent oxidoreductase [Lentisphaeraceae bacterium]